VDHPTTHSTANGEGTIDWEEVAFFWCLRGGNSKSFRNVLNFGSDMRPFLD
jgi:hypothetical protein